MGMSREEAAVQLKALAHEIESQERAIEGWEAKLVLAEEQEDKDEIRRLTQEIDGGKRTIKIANEQISILSGTAQTRQQRGQKR